MYLINYGVFIFQFKQKMNNICFVCRANGPDLYKEENNAKHLVFCGTTCQFSYHANQMVLLENKVIDDKQRNQRLSTNQKTLYHQTSPEAAEAIISSQTFLLGKTGVLGGGIYFAASITDTDRKAETKGVILEAEVLLGRIQTFTGPSRDITFQKLLKMGYDSTFIMMNSGPEYVVYNSDQVRNIRYASNVDIINRELTIIYPRLKAAKVLMLVVGKQQGERVAFIGRDARSKQYRLFGGTHDRKRSRGDNVRHEWCEEFGAFLKDQGMVCDPPTFEQLTNMPKIFERHRLEKGGPPQTNIIILVNVGVLNISESSWNRNNQKVRNDPEALADYKEIDKLSIIKLSELIQAANAVPTERGVSKGDVFISSSVLQAVRDFQKNKMI